LGPVGRVRLLNRLAGLLREHSRELAEIESLDVGKPLRQAEDDVAAAAGYFEYFAGVADKVFGSSIPLGKGFVDFTLREPLGVSAQIVPWNYPLRLASRGIAPALACGNAVVAKPAAEAGLSIIRLAELAVEAGLPPGVFNVVPGGSRLGRGLDNPDMGPVVSERQMERVLGFIATGAKDGARAVVGGRRADGAGLNRGFFIEPTLLDQVAPGTALGQEEIFGPVLTVTTFASVDEAIAVANGTPYGLVTGVWAHDLSRAPT